MNAYYVLQNRKISDDECVSHYQSTAHAQGVWNEFEQHMAVATGLLACELERFFPRDDLMIARLSLDILGVIHQGQTIVRTHFIRTGRTIELIESTLSTIDKNGNERISVIMRAWRLATSDSRAISGLESPPPQATVAQLPDWDGMSLWRGGYINSLRAKIAHHRAGKSMVWLNTDIDMVAGQETSDFVHLMGMVDTSNGTAMRATDGAWIFPSIDLQIHLYRTPQGRWLGLDTTQEIGQTGVGLTSSVLYDELGAFGQAKQILTVRHVGKKSSKS
ncbi:MAG: thioesterase family protein [Moraxella sp.]|nr:thioesterase family protein [Moraxella sp.]